jgi:hypothetical protein
MNLSFNGFETKYAQDTITASKMTETENFDLILANHSLIEKKIFIDSLDVPVFIYHSNKTKQNSIFEFMPM